MRVTRRVPSLWGTAARALLLAAALLVAVGLAGCGASGSVYERSPSTSTPSGELDNDGAEWTG